MDSFEPEQVKQLVFFLVDKSESMLSKYADSFNRFVASMKLITEFVTKTQELQVPSLFGSIIFNHTLEIRNQLSPLSDDFLEHLIIEDEKPCGGTALFKAIQKASELLLEANANNKYPNAALRIIVFSDGEDIYSRPLEFATITNYVLTNKIRVDSIYLSDEIENKLANLSNLTGSASYFPRNFTEGVEFVTQEPFIDSSLREFDPFHPATVTAQEISNLPKLNWKDVNSTVKLRTATQSDVKQLVFFLLDKSGSMSTPYGAQMSRMKAAVKFTTSFIEKAQEMNVVSLFGAILFNHSIELRCELTPNIELVLNRLICQSDEPAGGTALFAALKKARELLLAANENNEYPNATIRIVVFSDGEDVYAKPPQIAAVSNSILAARIRVDVVNLSPEVDARLAFLSRATGGASAFPGNFEEGLELATKEAFVDPEQREFGELLAASVTDADIENAGKSEEELNSEIKTKQ